MGPPPRHLAARCRKKVAVGGRHAFNMKRLFSKFGKCNAPGGSLSWGEGIWFLRVETSPLCFYFGSIPKTTFILH